MTERHFWVAGAALAFTFSSIGLAAPWDARPIHAPLSFEPNLGQADPAVQFVSHGDGYALYLKTGQVVLNNLPMTLAGANANSIPTGLARRSGVVNYFIGNDPKQWRTGIPTYGKVSYAQIYPGVDLVFYGNQRRLEYDFVVAPGVDPSRIAWRIQGARIDPQGNLVLNAAAMFRKPVVYQKDGDRKLPVEGSFLVAGNRVGFRLGRYDHSKPLVIDPVLTYVSYLDGSGSDTIGHPTAPGVLGSGLSQALALDSAGSVYVTGFSYSVDFPVKNAYAAAPPAKIPPVQPGSWPSAFVSKFSPDGASLVYSTYLGGSGSDYSYAIAVDSAGSAYVTGYTSSVDFPITSGAYQTVCSPQPTNNPPPYTATCNSANASVFLTKLDPSGSSLVYSTFLGGYGWAYGTAVAVDAAGNAYVAGNEDAFTSNLAFPGGFPTTNSAVISGDKPGGSAQYAFVAAFDPKGAHLLYSTLYGDLFGIDPAAERIGGAGGTYATGIAVDANGYFYLIGSTQAGKLPTTPGVVQPTGTPLYAQSNALQSWRSFVAKFYPLMSGGSALQYATYLGGQAGSRTDLSTGIAIDSMGNPVITGYTNSADFPVTPGAYGTVAGNGVNCSANYVAKLTPDLSAILWSTFVGNAKPDGTDASFAAGPIQLDAANNVYITGMTSTGFPMVDSLEPFAPGGAQEVYVAELDPTGSKLLFSTIIGSNALDNGTPAGLAVDATGNIYVAGNTAGPNLITTPGAFMTAANSSACCSKGFVARIAAQGVASLSLTSSQAGPALTLQAKVSPPQKYASLPTGQVVFLNGDSAFAVVTLDATGNAAYSTSTAPPGTYTITAQYSGDSTYAAASATITATLNPLP
jgi:hypothetical protein